jgi:hypothetical protein
MLASIIRAPAEMLKHAKVYGFLLILTGIHGFLYLLNADIFTAFTDGSVVGILLSNDTGMQARALGLMFVSLFFSVYSMGVVSRSIKKTFNVGKNSLFISSIAFSVILVATALGLFVVMSAVNSLSTSGGIASLLAAIFIAVGGLVTTLCVIKFSFAPSLVGMGLLPKEALAQSWNGTRGKILSVIIVLVAVVVVASFIQELLGVLTSGIEDETLLTIILFLGSTLGMFYSGTVLALAAPELSQLSPAHTRKK